MSFTPVSTQSIVPFIINNSTLISGATSGSPVVQSNVFDSTISSAAQTFYQQQMTVMQTAFTNIENSVQGGGTASQTDVQNYLNALNALNAWANMITVNPTTGAQNNPVYNTTTGTPPTSAYDPSLAGALLSASGASLSANTTASAQLTTTMSNYMGQALQQIDRMLQSVNGGAFSPDSFTSPTTGNLSALTATLTALAQPSGTPSTSNTISTDNTIYQLPTLMQSAQSAAAQAQIIGDASTQSQSLQQALAVDYIDDGNTMIYNNLNGLNQAININQQILQYLNALQDLMNSKSPQQFALQLTTITNTGAGISDSSYTTFENQSFNQQLGTTANYIQAMGGSSATIDGTSYTQQVSTANAIVQQAFGSINSLGDLDTTTFNYTQQTLINNINQLVLALQNTGASGSSGLVSALNQVKADLSSASSISTWIQDFSTTGTSSGTNQQDMNNATTAAQSFNQTQQANLQEAMFIFQQFYQSASGLLSQIDQVLSAAASNIPK